MKAIQFQPGIDLTNPKSALLTELPTPTPTGHDILVKIEAIALNPVDTKVRPDANGEPKTLGYDAAGTITAIGENVTNLAVGDQTYHAGDITRPGSNAEYQLVDSRIAAKRPTTLTAAESAALPLTSLTAYESLFHRLKIDLNGANSGQTILIIGGAGGVGSIAIQLAKLAGLTVITTASRPETKQWCIDLGADHILNHRDPLQPQLQPQLQQLGFEQVDYIANYNNTLQYWETMGQLIAPQGHIVLIVESPEKLELGNDYKNKSVTISWELMFTRSLFNTPDIIEQHNILTKIANLIDTGKIKTTSNDTRTPITPATLIQTHQDIESGKTIGKITLTPPFTE